MKILKQSRIIYIAISDTLVDWVAFVFGADVF
jgi:hypothetical protein